MPDLSLVLATGLAVALAAPPSRGLLLWLDASDPTTLSLDGDRVLSWTSKAPGGAGGAPVVTLAPFGSPRLVATPNRGPQAAVALDGRDDAFRALDFGRRATEWTLVAVVAPLKPARGAIASACPHGGADYDPGFTVDLYGATQRFDYLSVEGAGRQGGRLNQRTSATPFGVFSTVTVRRAQGEIALFVDGLREGTRPVSPAQTIMDELRIGCRFYDGREREFLNGQIAEVLLYDRALTEDECSALAEGRRITPAQRRAGEEFAMAQAAQQQAERMTPPTITRQWPTLADYARALEAGELPGPPLPLDALPIRTDLQEAIRLCVHGLTHSFDRDRDGEVFFYSNRLVDGTGEFRHSIEIGIPHVTGRCLLGVMAASLATGDPIGLEARVCASTRLSEAQTHSARDPRQPDAALDTLARYCRSSFDNPDHLNSYYHPEKGNARFVEFHNMREGLYGLWALMHTDHAVWARQTAAAMLRTLDSITDESGRWSHEKLEQAGMTERCFGVSVPNAARMVDPLLAVHGITADPLALKLAGEYARAGLADVYLPDGHFAPMDRSSAHVHSITSALSGITEYALLTGDADMVAACKRIIQVGVPEYFSSWGWGDEVFPEHPADEPSRGEINQTGDVIRAALHLGAAGEPEYFELAERYVRSMLLPTQHREEELRRFMHDKPEPSRDAERDVVNRSIGGYAMQLPNDRMQEGDWPIQTQDITSGAAHALAECFRHCVTVAGEDAGVNLLFTHDTPDLQVRSDLPLYGHLTLRAMRDLTVRLRIPPWVDQSTLRLMVRGGVSPLTPVQVAGGYLLVGHLAAGQEAEVTFDVPVRLEQETVDGIRYTTTWAGNQILDIRPRGTVSPLPF